MSPTRLRDRAALLMGLLLSGLPVAAGASPTDVFYERAVMSAAGQRCRLFTPQVSAALEAARIQARGAALRAGADAAVLDATGRRAQAQAARADCRGRDVAVAAGRVRSAFDGYARLIRMSFPGDFSLWQADRSSSRQGPGWRVRQTSALSGSDLSFGLAGQRGEAAQLIAVAAFAPGQEPYGARIVMRDPGRAPQPYLGVLRNGAGRTPLSARTPPRAAALVFQAQARGPADPLLASGGAQATAFRFPPAAISALAALDPREAVTVEFVFAGRGGDSVRQAYVEVGDFAAAQAFLAASPT